MWFRRVKGGEGFQKMLVYRAYDTLIRTAFSRRIRIRYQKVSFSSEIFDLWLFEWSPKIFGGEGNPQFRVKSGYVAHQKNGLDLSFQKIFQFWKSDDLGAHSVWLKIAP